MPSLPVSSTAVNSTWVSYLKPRPMSVICCPVLAEGFETSVGVPTRAAAVMPVKSVAGRLGRAGAGSSAKPPAVVTRIGPVTAIGAVVESWPFRDPNTLKS